MTTDPVNRRSGGSVHRHLDELFAGVEPTPDVQDLKEELRVSLTARAAELEASGAAPDEAARRAVAELGDVRALIDDAAAEAAAGGSADHRRHRVRPRPAFVVRTVILALVATAGVALLAVDAVAGLELDLGIAGRLACVVAIALSLGWVTADALRQETTTNHPLPDRRAAGFGVAVALVLAGLGIGWLVVTGLALPWLIAAAIAVVAGVAWLSWLGATATNRHKAWVLDHHAGAPEMVDAFSQDPAAAARFGIYTIVFWLLAAVAYIGLSLVVGWTWTWVLFIVAVALWFLMLARMLFPPSRR